MTCSASWAAGLVALGALVTGCATAPGSAPAEGGAASCDSACLEGLLKGYVDALTARNPAAAPVAPDVIFSENGVIQPFGEALWLTAGPRGSYWLPITDPDSGQAVVFTTLEERGGTDLFLVRIAQKGGKITEAEQMVVRQGGNVPPNVQTAPEPRLLAPVPPEERVSREELIRIADTYFEGLDTMESSEITPFRPDCSRRENGSITALNPDPKASAIARMDCKSQFDTGFSTIVTDIRDRRILVADWEHQLVFGFAFFDHSGMGNPQAQGTFARPLTFEIGEAFKVRGGQIEAAEALLFQVPYRMRTDFDRLSEARGIAPNNGR